MSKKSNILNDLKNGLVVNMLENIPRYGTSCRSRIAELRQEGCNIESVVVDDKSNALAYFIPEYIDARSELLKMLSEDKYSNHTINDLETIHKSPSDSYKFKDLDFLSKTSPAA